VGSQSTWTCAECGVRASFAPGPAPSEPNNWIEEPDGWHCLRCQREAAMDAVTAKGSDRATQRRRALIEFELIRGPERPDHVIANRASCPTSRVRPVRAELVEAGRIPLPTS
jgi:hypothetical protein